MVEGMLLYDARVLKFGRTVEYTFCVKRSVLPRASSHDSFMSEQTLYYFSLYYLHCATVYQ
jgi:hypothetical protein